MCPPGCCGAWPPAPRALPAAARQCRLRPPERASVLLADPVRGAVAHRGRASCAPRASPRAARGSSRPSSTGGAPRRCAAPPAQLPAPFTGGWALFLGYELAGEIEPQLKLPRTPLPWQAFALRTRARWCTSSPAAACASAASRAREEPARGHRARGRARPRRGGRAPPMGCASMRVHEEDPHAYLERVRAPRSTCAPATSTRPTCRAPGGSRCRLAAGERTPAAALYARLCAANPAPFAALAQWQGVRDPELLARAAGAGGGAGGRNAPDRRHAPAQPPARRRRGTRWASSPPTPRSAPSTSC